MGTHVSQLEANVLAAFRTMTTQSYWTHEDGDPCVPAHWEWVNCSPSMPSRITKMYAPISVLCQLNSQPYVEYS